MLKYSWCTCQDKLTKKMDNDKNCANDLNCNNVQYGKTKEIGKVEELSKADELRKVEDIANKIAKERGILDYKLQIVKGSMKGDNYIGVIHCVDVIGANGKNFI